MTDDQQPQHRIQPIDKARIVTLETIVYQSPTDDRVLVESRYGDWVETNEPPYQRRFKLTEQWIPIDTGWNTDAVGIVTITNNEGQYLQVEPTQEEIDKINEHVIEVGFGYELSTPEGWKEMTDPIFEVPAGRSMRGIPTQAKKLFLRCRKGTAKCAITVFPK